MAFRPVPSAARLVLCVLPRVFLRVLILLPVIARGPPALAKTSQEYLRSLDNPSAADTSSAINPQCTPCQGYADLNAGNYAGAMTIFRQLATEGNASAMTTLGYMFQHGQGAATDYAEAMSWYRKAASLGDTRGMDQIGYLYEEGLGVSKNVLEALAWYKKAADLGDSRAKRRIQQLAGAFPR
ncbi:MAG: sel1 repeat family protein [Pseudomonadota bacterium]|nr:sel1 repeat family protein [Pseudomonadota bacterium]